MKPVRMLSFCALAAMALMAWVGAAATSADVLCTENNTNGPCLKVITSLVATTLGSSVVKDTSGNTLSTCSSGEIRATIEKQGEGVEPEGPITSLTWSGCTATTETTKPGRLKIETRETAPGVFVHTVTLSGTVWRDILFGVTCAYGPGASPISLGDLTLGLGAVLHVNTVVNKVEGGFLCPSSGKWEATFQITNHTGVWVSKK